MAQPLERPVVIVQETSEEDKLLTLLNARESVYMRISPLNEAVDANTNNIEHPVPSYEYQQVTAIDSSNC